MSPVYKITRKIGSFSSAFVPTHLCLLTLHCIVYTPSPYHPPESFKTHSHHWPEVERNQSDFILQVPAKPAWAGETLGSRQQRRGRTELRRRDPFGSVWGPPRCEHAHTHQKQKFGHFSGRGSKGKMKIIKEKKKNSLEVKSENNNFKKSSGRGVLKVSSSSLRIFCNL